jgi:hypothetical protein
MHLPQGACLAPEVGDAGGGTGGTARVRAGPAPGYFFAVRAAVLRSVLRARGAGTARPCVCAFLFRPIQRTNEIGGDELRNTQCQRAGLFAVGSIASMRVGCGLLSQVRSADALLFFHVGDLLVQGAEAGVDIVRAFLEGVRFGHQTSDVGIVRDGRRRIHDPASYHAGARRAACGEKYKWHRASADVAQHAVAQLRGVEAGFDPACIGPHRGGVIAKLRIIQRGENDNRHAGGVRRGADAAEDFDAVEVRHHVIEDHHLGRGGQDECERFAAAVDAIGGETKALQQSSEDLAEVGVVVHYEYVAHGPPDSVRSVMILTESGRSGILAGNSRLRLCRPVWLFRDALERPVGLSLRSQDSTELVEVKRQIHFPAAFVR